jgi:hypothetical protein
MSKIEWEKAVVGAVLFTTVSYLVSNFILKRFFPAPEKPEASGGKGNLTGMPGCDCASRHWRGY